MSNLMVVSPCQILWSRAQHIRQSLGLRMNMNNLHHDGPWTSDKEPNFAAYIMISTI